METTVEKRLEQDLNEAEAKAWDSLARYKFQMFGYWEAIWVHLNRVGEFKRPNPWKSLVKTARTGHKDFDKALAEQATRGIGKKR